MMGGALPTLIGDEYTFTFENMNIERGLLWGQEPAVSKGVQLNFSHGPLNMSAAWTDGYYSGTFTHASGLISYAFSSSDTIAFAAEGNVARNSHFGFATPMQNQGDIFNLIYTHTQGNWVISPYIQYNSTPNNSTGSVAGDTWGGAILTKYSFTPEFSLAARAEYIKSDGAANLLGYGVGSSAWSLTLTPTYQKGIFFVRGEASYTGISGYSRIRCTCHARRRCCYRSSFRASPPSRSWALALARSATPGAGQFRLMGEAGRSSSSRLNHGWMTLANALPAPEGAFSFVPLAGGRAPSSRGARRHRRSRSRR